MSDWLHNLPIFWMTLVVFGFTYLLAAGIYGSSRPERVHLRQSLPGCCHHWALSSACLSRSRLQRTGEYGCRP
jgi:hypothetical protein